MATPGPKKKLPDREVSQPGSTLGDIRFEPLDSDPPAHLLPEAKIEWNRLRSNGLLARMHILQKSLVEVYCEAYGNYRRAQRHLAATPIETSTTIGSITQKWMATAKQHATALGLYGISAAPKSRGYSQAGGVQSVVAARARDARERGDEHDNLTAELLGSEEE